MVPALQVDTSCLVQPVPHKDGPAALPFHLQQEPHMYVKAQFNKKWGGGGGGGVFTTVSPFPVYYPFCMQCGGLHIPSVWPRPSG